MRRVQGRVLAQAFDEIGIGDEQLAEGDEIGAARPQRLDRKIARIGVVGDVGAAEGLAQSGEIDRNIIARTVAPFMTWI